MRADTKNERLALANQVVELCQRAGDAILSVYNSQEALTISKKADHSPVTEADLLAHRIIRRGLEQLTPGWPLLSEECAAPSYSERRLWSRYWLVDPLDGTREFIARTGEFTVNIALVEEGIATLGVVFLPLEQLAYIGVSGAGAWREGRDGRHAIGVSRALTPGGRVRVLTSSRYKGLELNTCISRLREQFNTVEWLKAGSAIKFCRLAEGRADFYPRFSPCCEWDTAAGQALLEAAGGQLLDTRFRRFRYNRGQSLINPHFYALGGAEFDWRSVLAS